MRFDELRLAKPILDAIKREGYTTATPIQANAIPLVLDGRDVVGCAQTGTGKTAAFALPILDRLSQSQTPPHGPRMPRVLVLSPTRELAIQIGDSFEVYGSKLRLKHAVIYGGVKQGAQVKKLDHGIDILVATPGRLMDLMNQGHVDLRKIETLVLDEADRMLDMGFVNDIRKIVKKVPSKRQTLLFSATMPPPIQKLANDFLHNPETVTVAQVSATADRVEQSVYFVDKNDKPKMLTHLLNTLPIVRAIVFTRTKHGADRAVRQLRRDDIIAKAIHGNKSQNARQRSLDSFRKGDVHVLIATDIASRGIDIDDISHVINYDLPNEPESYVHRIGRTARAGASGQAISLCAVDERSYLTSIERLIKMTVRVADDHPRGIPVGGGATADPNTPPPKRVQRGQRQGKPRSGNAKNARGGKPSSHAPRKKKSAKRSVKKNTSKKPKGQGGSGVSKPGGGPSKNRGVKGGQGGGRGRRR